MLLSPSGPCFFGEVATKTPVVGTPIYEARCIGPLSTAITPRAALNWATSSPSGPRLCGMCGIPASSSRWRSSPHRSQSFCARLLVSHKTTGPVAPGLHTSRNGGLWVLVRNPRWCNHASIQSRTWGPCRRNCSGNSFSSIPHPHSAETPGAAFTLYPAGNKNAQCSAAPNAAIGHTTG